MIFKNKKIQKLFSFLLIFSIIVPVVLFSGPKQTQAVVDVIGGPSNIFSAALNTIRNVLLGTGNVSTATTATKAVQSWYQVVLQEVLRAVARKALQSITKSTVNWINGGFHGSPLFVENPKSFFQDIAKSEIKTLVDQFGYDLNRFPFGKDWALNTIGAYKNTLANNAAYTLNQAMSPSDATNFRTNFNVGGWNGFLTNTQYPQNNYLGFNMIATNELALRISGTTQTATQKVQTTLQQGNGFLSPQTCPSNLGYNNGYNEFNRPRFDEVKYRDEHPSSSCSDQNCLDKWRDDYEKAKADWAKTNTCPGGLVNTTPGSVVSNQITTALGSQFRQSELGAAMGNSLSAVFDALLNKFLGDGLNALASTANPTPVPDTWNYNGLTLGGPGDSDWASGPDQEIILKDFRILIEGKTIHEASTGEQLYNQDGSPMKTPKGIWTPDLAAHCSNSQYTTQVTCTSPGHNGTWVLASASGNCSYPEATTEADCLLKGGDLVLAQGGETISEIGDTRADKSINPSGNKEYFPGDIANTQTELALMDTFDSSDPTNTQGRPAGIVQALGAVISNTQTLDQCLPGPDKGWEFRLTEEQNRVIAEIQSESGGENSDNLKKKKGNDVAKELTFAVNSFKNWITTQMVTALPGAMLDIDAINKISDFAQQLKELTDTKKTKFQALMRVSSIKNLLDELSKNLATNVKQDGTPDPLTQPISGSPQEKQLILYKKQYDALKISLSSDISVEDSRNQLNIANEQYKNLTGLDIDNPRTKTLPSGVVPDPDPNGLIPKCRKERADKGWSNPDTTGRGEAKDNSGITEIYKFCGSTPTGGPFTGPIASGYSHGDVLRNDQAAREMNCFPDPHLKDPGGCNTPSWDTTSWFTFRNPNAKLKAQSSGFTTPNGPFSPLPEDYGDLGYEDLPMVNAMNILGDDRRIDGTIDCRNVFKARKTDYTSAGDLNN